MDVSVTVTTDMRLPKSRRQHHRRATLLLLAAAVVAAGCGSSSSSNSSSGSSTKSPIKVGLIGLGAGPFATNGQASIQGSLFAVQQINAAGGINGHQIQIIQQDTQNDPSSMSTIVRKLYSDGVVAIIGPILSGECQVGCPLAKSLQLPILSPSVGTADALTTSRPWSWTLVAADERNSTPALQAVLQRDHVQSAAIMTDESQPTTKALQTYFQQQFAAANVKIVDQVGFLESATSYSAQITSLKASHPQVVAFAAGAGSAAAVAQQAQQQGFTTTYIGTGALSSAGQALITAGGSAVNGMQLAAQFNPNNPDPTAHKLLAAYEQATNTKTVSLNAAFGYDAVDLLANVLRQVKATDLPGQRTAIMNGINGTKGFTGMGGTFSFSSAGSAVRAAYIATVTNGQFAFTQVAASAG